MLIRPQAPSWALTLTLLVPTPASFAADVVPVVQVSGARYDQRREETAASVVVGREELLRHGDRSLADALKRVAGITIGSGGGRGTDIRLRGLGDGYTQVLLDGVAAPNGFSLESLAPELIERVEIVRTASAELGTQSIAGTVNIVLRKAAAPARTNVKLGLDRQRGAYSSSLSSEAGGKGSSYSYAVPVTLSRTRVATLQLADETAPGVHREATQDEMNAATTLAISPRANWVLANGDKVDLRGLVNASRRSIDMAATERVLEGSGTRYPARGSLFTTSATWLRADAGWTRQFGQGARLEVKAGAETTSRNADFDFGAMRGGEREAPVHFVRADFDEHALHGGATYTAPARAGHTVSAGVDGARSRRSQIRIGRDLDVPGIAEAVRDERFHGAIDRSGLFIQDAWEIDGALSLSAGWRGEVLTTSVTDAATPSIERRNVIGSPLLQVLYKVGEGVQWRAGLARTYKAPTMFKLIPRRFVVDNNNSATNPDTQGNPGLRPEKAWGLDIGYDHYFGKESLLAVSAYVRRIDDVTVERLFLDGPTWVATPDNQGRALARGLALEAKFPLPWMPRIAFSANLARNWSRVDRIAGPDNRIDEQAPFSGNVGIEYRGAIKAGANLTYARGAPARMSTTWVSLNGDTRALDIYAVWGAGKGMRLRVAATNLLEKEGYSGARYQDSDGVRQTVLRRSTGAALRLTLECDL